MRKNKKLNHALKYILKVSAMLTFMFTFSLAGFAENVSCEKPEEKFFTTEYIMEYLGHPNWSDECFELEAPQNYNCQSSEECTAKCYKEAAKWERWYHFQQTGHCPISS